MGIKCPNPYRFLVWFAYVINRMPTCLKLKNNQQPGACTNLNFSCILLCCSYAAACST